MKSTEIRKKFLQFFLSKDHKIIPSSSLVSNNKTVLFTVAGMQQLVPYLSGQKDPIKDFGTRHLASCQKCFRTNDIEEVGDDRHYTFFEMLGNWSIGQDKNGYFKKGAIDYAWEFLIDILGLEKDRIWVSVFKGDEVIPVDNEAVKLWESKGIPSSRIKYFGRESNFWGPVSEEGPCGPCSEIFYSRKERRGENFNFDTDTIEIWNLVFMQYFKDKGGHFRHLDQTNIDTGIGLERIVSILDDRTSAYETDLFSPLMVELSKLTAKNYFSFKDSDKNKRYFRIIADHIRAAVFLISDGVLPSNLAQGYVLRRILRRAIRFGKLIDAPYNFLVPLAKVVINSYKDQYPGLFSQEEKIVTVIQNEEEKFEKTLSRGLRELNKIIRREKINNPLSRFLSGEQAFNLYQTYGFPIEMVEEIGKENNFRVDRDSFRREFEKHRNISRMGMKRKFGGHGVEKVKSKEERKKIIRLHTATHLLQAALREILGPQVKQVGSDITPERLRFDFTFSGKPTKEELRKVENLVNEKIKDDLLVKKEEMPLSEALKTGALAFFREKYPKRVSVYSIGNFSKEICAGPHVNRTSELGHFKIIKEKSSGAGVRRIKAILY